MSLRKGGLIAAIACASMLVVPVAANAQSNPKSVPVTTFSSIPVSGKANNGKAFSGHFAVTQFVTRNGKTYALGTLTGHVGHRFVRRSNVAIPMAVKRPGMARAAVDCPILHLTLGPLDLNLLGLHVHLNQVVLDITAQSGPGNLLGNLLCNVASILNNNSLLSQELTSLFNILQQILNTPPILGF